MLRPPDLTSDVLPVALKPALGYEGHLLVSLKQHLEPGALEILGTNSGTYTASQADLTALDADPMELLAMLDTDADLGSSNLVITVTGTSASGALEGTATFAAPAYANMQERVFGRCWAVQVESGNVPFKTITGVTVACHAKALGTRILLVAVPALTTFQEVLCKTQVDVTPKIPMPHSIACGRDQSAYTKPGEIPIGTVSISAKVVSSVDGLARINGRRVTALIRTKKEDKVVTDHMFLLGMILTAKTSLPDGVGEQSYAGDGQTEETPFVIAPLAA